LSTSWFSRAAYAGWLGDWLGVNDINAKVDQVQIALQKELDETRKALADSVNVMSRTMPGERYLRLIDDLNSGDEKKVAAAQAFLKSLAHIDASLQYEMVVNYDFDTNRYFKTDFERFRAPSPDLFKAFVDNSITPYTPSDTILAPSTELEVRAKIGTEIDGALNSILGAMKTDSATPPAGFAFATAFAVYFPDPIFRDRRGYGSPMNEVALAQKEAAKLAAAQADDVRKRRDEWVMHLTDAIMSANQYRETRMVSNAQTKDWPLFDGKSFVVIFIDRRTYDEQPTMHVKFEVRRKDKPQETLGNRPIVDLTRVDFDPKLNIPIRARNGIEYLWAYREMTGEPNISPEQVAMLIKVRENLKQYQTAVGQ
jgi:hypothetical protein